MNIKFSLISVLVILSSIFCSYAKDVDASNVAVYTGKLTPVDIDRTTLGEMEKYVTATYEDDNGDILVQVVVPDLPSDQRISGSVIQYLPLSSTKFADVPAFNWTYGCSATSAGMLCGYYDRNGYPNLYTGTVNGGVCPLDNSAWGADTAAGSSVII